MKVSKLTSENFKEEVINSEKIVLVDFYADWCGPCQTMSPILDEIAKKIGENARVGKINVDENRDLAIKYDVMSIPTIIIFKQGKPVKTFVGVQDKETLLNELK